VTPDEHEALRLAHMLIAADIPVFAAPPATTRGGAWDPTGGTGGCGYWLPHQWQKTAPDSAWLDPTAPGFENTAWRPGWALCAVMGHGLDLLDVDPRNGGDGTRATLLEAGVWPVAHGVASTPSGGTHEFITSLGVGSRDAVRPGLDVKGGKIDGTSRGCAFIAPTAKLSKVTGKVAFYQWTTLPDLDGIDEDDNTGAEIAEMVRTARGNRDGHDGRTGGRASSKNTDSETESDTGRIPEGLRHAALLSFGGSLRARGLPFGEAKVLMEKRYGDCVQPPDARTQFTVQEAQAILTDVYDRYPPGESVQAGGSASAASPRRYGPDSLFGRNGLLLRSLVAAVEARVPTATGSGGRLYTYADGIWLADDRAVRAAVVDLLGESYRKSHTASVVDALSVRPPSITDATTDTSVLNLANGLLDWRIGALGPHSPDVIAMPRIPIPWDPDATCPAIMAWLGEVFDPDALDFVLEIIGYALLNDNPLHKAFLLFGRGRNGKSTFLKLVTALLGAANICAVTPQELDENRFKAAELYGKLANVVGDVDPRIFKATEVFKQVTGGDVLTAERKYGQPFSFRPRAKLLAAFNAFPRSADTTEGFFSRWIVVPFTSYFSASAADPAKLDKLTDPAEMRGLLVLAVAGLQRLMARGRFDPPASILAATSEFRRIADPVRMFLDEYIADHEALADGESTWVARAEIYGGYQRWTDANGYQALAAGGFYEGLEVIGDGGPLRVTARKRRGKRGYTLCPASHEDQTAN
jgi:P4 family phage/plasmid primase-like protien